MRSLTSRRINTEGVAYLIVFFFSSRRRHTRLQGDWSSDVCSSDLQGDIALTPLGETFAEASVLARKSIFGVRIRRLPVFQWLVAQLRQAEENRLSVKIGRASCRERV